MCGRYTLSDPSQLQLRFGLVEFADLRLPPTMPRFNIAPSQVVPVVVETDEGRRLEPRRWGFQPTWMKPGKTPPPINARAEGLATSGLFRTALARRRCVVPADGFYEWTELPGLKRKQPYHIRLKGGGLFGFAGIWTPGQGDHPPTCAIVTTTPNELVAGLHNRMPVILDPDGEALWLDRGVTEPEPLRDCLRPYPADRMEAYPVSARVGAPANDDPDLLRRLDAQLGWQLDPS